MLMALIGGYQRFISPFLGNRCRFHPSCSAYAKTAVETHGALRGSWLALRRLLKCAPWHPGGVDLVPGTERSPAGTGTGEGSRTSSSSVPPALLHPAHSATPPALRRANEESSVA